MSLPYEINSNDNDNDNSTSNVDNTELKILKKILTGTDENVKKDNGNVDGETAMGTALHVFSNLSKQLFLKDAEFIPPETAKEITDGSIYAHDLEFFNLTATCCQIDMFTLLRKGFNGGKGQVRGSKRFVSACTNFCVIIQGNQNEMHGGQCLVSSKLVLTRIGGVIGYTKIGEIATRYSTEVIEVLSLNESNGIMEWKAVTYAVESGNNRRLINLRTKSGRQTSYTDNHRMLTPVAIGGEITAYGHSYRETFKVGEVIPERLKQAMFPHLDKSGFEMPDRFSPDVYYLLGCYAGNGKLYKSCEDGSGWLLITPFYARATNRLLETAERLRESGYVLGIATKPANFNLALPHASRWTEVSIQVNSELLTYMKERYGVDAEDKKLDLNVVFEGSIDARRGLLSGLFDADIPDEHRANTVCCTTVSEILKHDICWLASSFGEHPVVEGRWHKHTTKEGYCQGWTIRFSGDAVNRIFEGSIYETDYETNRDMEFHSGYAFVLDSIHLRKEDVGEHDARLYNRGKYRHNHVLKRQHILNGVKNGKLPKFFQTVCFSEVEERTEGNSGEEYVYDIEVADNHNFVDADGFIVHNCNPTVDYDLGRFVDVEFLYQVLKIYETRPEHTQPKERIELLKKLRDELLANDDRVYYYFVSNTDPATEYDYEYPEPINTIKSWFDADEWYQIITRVKDSVYQGMESIVYNLSFLHSRAGAQVPFSSVNFGTCTSWEGRLVSKALLKAQWNGLGNGETALFPITIFKVKDGINYNPSDRNYDLLLESIKVSAKRLFPNFSFQDSSTNKPFWRPSDPLHEVGFMGCRTRTVTNVYDKKYEQTTGRGNVSFTTVNLPYTALECKRENPDFTLSRDNVDEFFDKYVLPKMVLLRDLLLRRLRIVGARSCAGQPFLMGEDVWLDNGYVSTTEYLKHVHTAISRLRPSKSLSEEDISRLKERYKTITQAMQKYEDENGTVVYKSEEEKYLAYSPIYSGVDLEALREEHRDKYGVLPTICEVTNPILEGWLFDLPEKIHNKIIAEIRRPHTLRDPQIQRLKLGSLSIGYIGLAECLTALYGQHHGESETANLLGHLIIQRMRQVCDEWAEAYKLNFSVLQTPAEGLCFTALLKLRDKFGVIAGVSDKQYLTNSSHVPVGYKISAYDKVRIECHSVYDARTAQHIPGYSALANAGHICYVEMDGDPGLNPDAFLQILQYMHDNDVGYGAINHPLDRDPVCGYTGVI